MVEVEKNRACRVEGVVGTKGGRRRGVRRQSLKSRNEMKVSS
jgi:hypothetical protein